MKAKPAGRAAKLRELVSLSRRIGTDPAGFAILGEGNTSTRSGADTFWVKASGTSLATAAASTFTECRRSVLASLWKQAAGTDAEVDELLLASRVNAGAKKPSTEALFHAYLLSLPEIEWVAHTHPVAINGILCSPGRRTLPSGAVFPMKSSAVGTNPFSCPIRIRAFAWRRLSAGKWRPTKSDFKPCPGSSSCRTTD